MNICKNMSKSIMYHQWKVTCSNWEVLGTLEVEVTLRETPLTSHFRRSQTNAKPMPNITQRSQDWQMKKQNPSAVEVMDKQVVSSNITVIIIL